MPEQRKIPKHIIMIFIFTEAVSTVLSFVKTITDSFVINGSMFDDDGTTS